MEKVNEAKAYAKAVKADDAESPSIFGMRG
jgi:hypothetical protein